ncbi:MAG TPA: hypothetical protein VLA96_02390 [Terriglobales bacterium]|nr:hypothetical protein [Terriglobales bacterium]
MSKKKPKRKANVRKVRPTHPAARDEGPRLIPLDIRRSGQHFGRAIELADIALGLKQPAPKTSQPKRQR